MAGLPITSNQFVNAWQFFLGDLPVCIVLLIIEGHCSCPVVRYVALTVREISDLVRTLIPRLVLFARQWTDFVEDAVQEAFISLYRLPTPPDDMDYWRKNG